MVVPRPELPRDVEDRLADALFRSGEPDDAALRDLLRQNPEHETTLRRRLAELGFSDRIPGEPEDRRLGPYRLHEVLGEGGFGVVYAATHAEADQRRVAVKRLKPGMDSRHVLKLFEQESRVLAAMDHPSIVSVLDSGIDERGRAYYVMERVDGLPMTRFVAEQDLDGRASLRLFRKVCLAVHHAHQKGVIHQDLKPTNILVVRDEDGPSPRLIDFGLASLIGAREGSTISGARLDRRRGTLPYMAPEQLARHRVLSPGAAIDTRADVYSLGVVLFELLTGTLPFPDPPDLSPEECEAQILECKAPRPTQRLRDREGSQESMLARRLPRRTLRDLDWITLRCLAREPERRYASASELARDLDRALSDEPVEAGPPGAGYRLGKFLRRNRAVVVSGGAVLITLVAGIIGTTHGLRRAEANARRAERERDRTRRVGQFHVGELWSIEPLQVGRFLREQLTEELAKREPGPTDEIARRLSGLDFTGLAVDTLATQVIAPAQRKIERDFAGDPLVQAELLQTIAILWSRIGRFDDAEAPLERALAIRRRDLGPEHPSTMRSLDAKAWLLREQGRLDEARELQMSVIDARWRAGGEPELAMLQAMLQLARIEKSRGDVAAARTIEERTIRLCHRHLPPGHDLSLVATIELGESLHRLGASAEALPLQERIAAEASRHRGEGHPVTLRAQQLLATTLDASGDFDRAAAIAERVLESRKSVEGEDHPLTLGAMNTLAIIRRHQGRLREARTLHEDVLARRRSTLGPRHPATLRSTHNLSRVLASMGALDDALSLQTRLVESRREVLGDDHPETLASRVLLAESLVSRGESPAAEAQLRDVIERSGDRGDARDERIAAWTALSAIRLACGDIPEARSICEQAFAACREHHGERHRRTLRARDRLADALARSGRLEEACGHARATYAIRRTARGDDDPATLWSMSFLASLLSRLGRHETALPLFERELGIRRRVNGARQDATLRALYNLARGAANAGDTERARELAAEALRRGRDVWGAESPRTRQAEQLVLRLRRR